MTGYEMPPDVMAHSIRTLQEGQREQVKARERDREQAEAKFVSQEVYERDLGEIKTDIADIKDTNKKVMWFVVGEMVTLLVGIVLLVASRGFI